MKLNATTFIIFVISVVLALLSVFIPLQIISAYAFWVLLIGYIVLVAGNVLKGA